MESEHELIDGVVTQLNNTINQFLNELFDVPVYFQIHLNKKLKNSKVNKQCVNFTINVNGIQYDNILNVSGGEGDRISLALTIALSFNNKFPMIILDETISSLNEDLREKVLNMMSKYTHKTILIVDHAINKSNFQNVIQTDIFDF